MMQKDYYLTVEDISDRFGITEMLADSSKNNAFLASFLYYFGVLTLAGEDSEGEVILKVPNLVIWSLYVERVQKMLLPEPGLGWRTISGNGKYDFPPPAPNLAPSALLSYRQKTTRS